MSSVVRTSQIPYFSFHRSSTPTPYSFGKPALNCCGGSLSTLGNMKRPVAASAAADAAENAPQARPIQARRVSSGDVSSGSRVAAFAAAGAAVRAAAPPGDAALVVLPARSGIGAAGGRGAGAGFGACAPAAAGAGAAVVTPAAAGPAPGAGVPGTTGFCSSAILPQLKLATTPSPSGLPSPPVAPSCSDRAGSSCRPTLSGHRPSASPRRASR